MPLEENEDGSFTHKNYLLTSEKVDDLRVLSGLNDYNYHNEKILEAALDWVVSQLSQARAAGDVELSALRIKVFQSLYNS